MPWSRAFDEPIPLPSGKDLRTLREAATFVQSLPKSEQEKTHWQAAVEALILVAEHDGDPMLARIGMMRALNPGRPAPTKLRKKAVKAYRVIG